MNSFPVTSDNPRPAAGVRNRVRSLCNVALY